MANPKTSIFLRDSSWERGHYSFIQDVIVLFNH